MSVGWKVITSAPTVPVTTSPKMEGLTATKNTKHEKNSGTTIIEESYGDDAILDGSNGPTDLKTTNPPTSMAYPNCDLNIWLRSCEIEVINPLEGITTGAIPLWVNGSLYRNGPGKQDYGRQRVNHLFDAAGLLHKFNVRNGKVTYQSRYVNSTSYVLNTAAGQLVVPEFTTPAAPDPCKSIFHRISSLFVLDQVVSDNAMISIYPLGKDLYAFAETPFIHRIDPVTMETTRRESLHETLSVFNQSSHPHITESGEAYQLGQKIGAKGPSYVVIHYPPDDQESKATERARVVTTVPCRSLKEPSYMHSFSITDSYFVLIEQPLNVSFKTVLSSFLSGKPLVNSLKWRPNKKTRIRVISRKTGAELPVQYVTEAFFFLHTVNAFEADDHLIVDICCYANAKMLDCMYIDALENAQSDPNYASLFRGRPKRFVMPLNPKQGKEGNLNTYAHSLSEAKWMNGGSSMYIKPDELCPLGCETPQINYNKYNGKPYRYFYAISSDVDAENPGTLIKVDTIEKKCRTWAEKNVYASEPVFVPHPDAKSEDDGVLLSSMIFGGHNEKRTGLLVLDAATFKEIGRTEFHTPSPVPKCLHGYFSPTK
ncbi:carotenoid isomerooxygenase-like isoform X2 [Daphnia pulex]|uniref:carotenoid isomerooxygenase-like isoform X2 n=1 Tax=Daphnia pulex TaxID=6669 RepID=UPI001EDE58FC|nr:carotenoid isomerooxygenase-like isoform X2 [Daphnia pulex]